MAMKKKIKEKTKEKKKAEEDDENEEDLEEDGATEEELGENISNAEEEVKKLKDVLLGGEDVGSKIIIKGSKPISALKKGDKVKVDGKEYEVDAHYILMDHGKTKEMTIEIFDPKTDKDFQLRYFSDQVETSMEFYELAEILYVRKPVQKVEW